MKANDIILLCLAYILGLLLSPVKWGMYIVLGIGMMGGLIIPFVWKNAPKIYIWIIGGIIGLLAAFYLQTTIPQPAINDISKFVQKSNNWQQEQIVNIQGEILTNPKLTRNGRSQFNLEVHTIHEIQNINNQPNDGIKKATGQLYVTVPILQSLGLYPGQKVAVIGVLYQPQKTTNPGSFDWGTYLAKNGIFAGLKGRQVIIPDEQKNNWGWWKIQQRIIKSLVKDLGTPEGILVSAMVLGNKVVDLPYYITDSFRQVGLSHALAASGFQVSLILGFIILITARFSAKIQFLTGLSSLIILVGLTGVQPSIMRAVFMGIGALIALQQKRQVKVLGSLFLSGVILLLWQPRWINDLGFQMSFLATFGLIVSATPLAKKLDFLPSAIANIIAVPIAATIWILPIQLYNFGVVSPYSIIANI
ncbi:MAG TPA: ComEC/Rec2 family competence protein, partial [Allocoleopsis sp.]